MDYSLEAWKVVQATTPKKSFPPSLTFDRSGWWFDGINYGSDEAAAKKARDVYYGKDADDLEGVL